MMLTQTDAIAIAKKLEAEINPGRKHDLVVIRVGGKYIGQFGIQRSSKEKSHNYIARQMFITSGQCREFRDCSFSLKDYIELLRTKSALD
jgi:hypothetical protein